MKLNSQFKFKVKKLKSPKDTKYIQKNISLRDSEMSRIP